MFEGDDIYLFGCLNALIICKHDPHRGCEIAMEITGAFTKVLPRQCGENTQGLLYSKKGSEMKKTEAAGEKSSVFTNEQTRRVGLIAVICWTKKSKSPLFPGVGGVVITND